jgi:hypothetical protein
MPTGNENVCKHGLSWVHVCDECIAERPIPQLPEAEEREVTDKEREVMAMQRLEMFTEPPFHGLRPAEEGDFILFTDHEADKQSSLAQLREEHEKAIREKLEEVRDELRKNVNGFIYGYPSVERHIIEEIFARHLSPADKEGI